MVTVLARALPALAILALVAAALAAFALVARGGPSGAPERARPNPAYATQSSSRDAVHSAYTRWGNTDRRNMMGAACEAHSVEGWAALLHTAPTVDAVSRAVARSAEPAFRRGAYLGCRDALLGG